ncbi:hypothetical protein [Gaetbulibacter aestuarii]|uniref:Uncharacterized protein n=1 Tax=Gaetbulibacter aestuarii TaxID=1502358 RepID=A0ABW7MZ68_9FLAO
MIYTPLHIIFLVVIFLLMWWFANTIDKRKWLSFLIALVLTPFVFYYVFYPVLNIFSSYHHEKYFDAEAWKEEPALRYEMSDNMISDSLFIGKTKAQVEKQLGEAEWYGWDDNIKANSPELWNYNLGFEPGAFNHMQECLELTFDHDTVTAVKQYQLEKEFE